MAKYGTSVYIGGIAGEFLSRAEIEQPSLFIQRLIEISMKNGLIGEALASQSDSKLLKKQNALVQKLKKEYDFIESSQAKICNESMSHPIDDIQQVEGVDTVDHPNNKGVASVTNGLAGFVLPK